MIVAVCLNPAVDVTYTVDALRPGASHRVGSVRRRAGGKGVNVAAVLHQQQVPALVTGPVGGSAGDELTADLAAAGIDHRFSAIAGATRQTVTVVAADQATVLNEPGPELTADEWRAFTTFFADTIRDASVVTLSGSLPRGVRPTAYAELITLAREHHTVVVLDCDGPALTAALPTAPHLLKINHHEAAAATGTDTSTVDGCVAAAHALHQLGAVEVVITRGADGVVARTTAGCFLGTDHDTVSGNPTGAGDAFTAGLAAATADGAPWPARLRQASAWAAAAVAMPVAGQLDPRTAQHHLTTTVVEELAP